MSSVSTVRQRRPTPPADVASGTPTSPSDRADGGSVSLGHRSGLSAPTLLDSSPQYHGPVRKLHVPQLYSVLPGFLQRWISSIGFLAFLCPSWKERYLVVCGSFLYKFSSESSKEPKGSPFDLRSVETGTASVDCIDGGSQLPSHCKALITVSTLRRQHVYAVGSAEEAQVWLRTLDEARQEAITREMGHANHVPYPTRWKHLDALGRSLLKRKERIRGRMESSQMREMEMSSFVDGGALPRGYHG